MRHTCTHLTDLDELIGLEHMDGNSPVFEYGPLPRAMRNDEELVLENSGLLSCLTLAKIEALMHGLFIPETEERLEPGGHFRLVLH